MGTNTNFSLILGGLIHLNPLGGISALDFLTQSTDLNDARLRISSNNIQSTISTVAAYIFFINTCKALKCIYPRPSNIIYWCYFIQAFMGVIHGSVAISNHLVSAATCRVAIWMAAIGLTVSSICTIICLLIKAYMVQMRDKRILITGVIFIPLTFVNIWGLIFDGESLYTVEGSCVVHYSSWYPISRGCIEIFINSIFSYVFFRVVIQQYNVFGSKCWSKLKSDSILYLLCVTITNLFCTILTVTRLFGPLTEMLFLVDCK
jgi:hypothetical protein